MRLARLIPLAACLMLISACQTTSFKVLEGDLCPVPAQQLTAQCASPRNLSDGATYDDLVALAIEDKENLRLCAEQATFLRSVIEQCNDSIEKHNAKIREINAKLGK